jgi:DNA-binding LacI/PurR family transcriptional regulator
MVAAGRAVVTIDDRVAGADAVLAENRAPMAALVRHLGQVHRQRRIACVAGPARWPSTSERVAGIRDGARDVGATVSVHRARETTIRDGAGLVDRLLDDRPDAIVAVNDAMAIGVLHRLRVLPPARRPAVTGFDDISWAALTDPPLTTVAVDAPGIGITAARLLLDRLSAAVQEALPGREIRVAATLRVRSSCGCQEAGSDSEAASISVPPGGTGPARRRVNAHL